MRRQSGIRFRQIIDFSYAYGRNGKAARPARFVVRIAPGPHRICRRCRGLIGLSQERCRTLPARIRFPCAAFRRASGSRHSLEFIAFSRPRARGTRPPHQFLGRYNRSRSRNAEARRTRKSHSPRNRAPALHQERARFLACHNLAARSAAVQSRSRRPAGRSRKTFGPLPGRLADRQLPARPGHRLLCRAGFGCRRRSARKSQSVTLCSTFPFLNPCRIGAPASSSAFPPPPEIAAALPPFSRLAAAPVSAALCARQSPQTSQTPSWCACVRRSSRFPNTPPPPPPWTYERLGSRANAASRFRQDLRDFENQCSPPTQSPHNCLNAGAPPWPPPCPPGASLARRAVFPAGSSAPAERFLSSLIATRSPASPPVWIPRLPALLSFASFLSPFLSHDDFPDFPPRAPSLLCSSLCALCAPRPLC